MQHHKQAQASTSKHKQAQASTSKHKQAQASTSKHRIVYLDILRILAIILVLETHAVDRSGDPSLAYLSLRSFADRMGVPLFLMISGSLLIPKIMQLPLRDVAVKYGLRIIRFTLLTALFSIITNAVVHYFTTELSLWKCVFSAAYMYNFIFDGKFGYAWQLWYMTTIIGLYTIAPFLAYLLAKLGAKGGYALCSMQLLPLIGIPVVREALAPFCNIYIAYFVLGYLLSSRPCSLHNIRRENWILASIVTMLCAITLYADIIHGSAIRQLHWYPDSPTLLISSCCVFRIVQNCMHGTKRIWGPAASLARCSFGIYLWHYAILYITTNLIPTGDASGWGVLPYHLIYFAIPLGLSWILTWAGSRIPVLSKFLP